MQKRTAFLIVFCLYLCISYNSTLPLYRNILKSPVQNYDNQSQKFDFIERTKKMASNLQSTVRRIKDSTQDFGKNMYDHFNVGIKYFSNKYPVSEDDLRQYEEMVIMKKYPYLDLKELAMKYRPSSNKNTRQSSMFSVDRSFQNEPGISDTGEDLVNVEIINRGLSGFAIPPSLVKHPAVAEIKLKNNEQILNNNEQEHAPISKIPVEENVLRSLKQDINNYMEQKGSL